MAIDFAKLTAAERDNLIAEFAVDFAPDEIQQTGDHLTLRGPLFRAGEYPDKKFSLSPEELYRVIRGFASRGKPAPMDLAHQPLGFGGVDTTGWFGEIDRVWASDDAEWLMAEVTKPTWLHDVMPETKVSASFAREDKSLVGAAWTSTPRVEGAELVAAFAQSLPEPVRPVIGQFPQLEEDAPTFAASTKGPGRPRHDTTHGQMAMQRIHDAAAEAGALCQNPTAQMASRHERSAIQAVHDTAVDHGAMCSSVDNTSAARVEYSSSLPSGDGTSPDAQARPVLGRDRGSGGQSTSSQRRNTLMSIRDLLKGVAKDRGVDLSDEEIEAEFSKSTPDPRVDELKAKLDEQAAAKQALENELQAVRESAARHDAQFAASAAENRKLAAANFATEMVAARGLPGDAAAPLQALFERISESDSTATFSDGEKPTADLLAEFVATLPDIKALFGVQGMAARLDPTSQTKGLGPDTTEYTPERRAELLKFTQTGKAILADESKAATSNGAH